MTDHRTNRHGRRGQAARGRHQEGSRQRSGGPGVTGRGRANPREPAEADDDQEDNFRDDTEKEVPAKLKEQLMSDEMRDQLEAVCDEAKNALRSHDIKAALKAFNERIKPQLRDFYNAAHESLYCLLYAVYVIGSRLKRQYGRGSGSPMYKAIIGKAERDKTFLKVLKGFVTIPETDPERKLVNSRLSDYNCALEQAYHENLSEDDLLYRLSKGGGVDRLLKDGRDRTATEKGGDRKKEKAGGGNDGVSDASLDEDDLFSRNQATSISVAPITSPKGPNAAAVMPSQVQKPVDALLVVGDEAMRSVTWGRGRHVAIIDIAHAKPPTVTIELVQSLTHHDCDNDEDALDRMITSVRSSKSKK